MNETITLRIHDMGDPAMLIGARMLFEGPETGVAEPWVCIKFEDGLATFERYQEPTK